MPGIGSHAIDNADLHKTPIWNELMRLEKIEEVVGVILDRQHGNVLWLGFYNDQPIGPEFSPNLTGLKVLAPHFRRALELSCRIGELEESAAAHRALLDSVSFGVLALNSSGQILDANRAAATLLDRNDGIASLRGRLQLADPQDQLRLHEALARAAALRIGDALRAQRPSNRLPLRLLVVPAHRDSDHSMFSDLSSKRSVLVLVEDSEAVPVITPEILMRVFDLSRAESQLVVALAAGHTVARYAREAHLTDGTVRQYLKSAMGKLGVHRQAELVAMIRGSVLSLSTPQMKPLPASAPKGIHSNEPD